MSTAHGWDARQWRGSREPLAMLGFPWPRLSSDRKFWLFTVACWREVWDSIEPATREAVERLERFADAPQETWTQEAWDAIRDDLTPPAEWQTEAAQSAPWDARRARREVVALLGHYVLSAAERSILFDVYYGFLDEARAAGPEVESAWRQQEGVAADLLRDVVGDPFLPPPALAPKWLEWGDRIAHRIALAIHDEGDFGRLPVLGDALEEAGCCDGVVLGHCRGGGRHARGCWVVDLVRGRHVLVDRPRRGG